MEMDAANTPILTVEGLSKSYGKHPALHNINLSIEPGQIVGLLGPNGSGKTTLIKTITGLLTSYTGAVTVVGHQPGLAANTHIAYLPDKAHVPTWLKVSQAVGLFADFYADFDRERALHMLSAMNIPLNKRLKNLSRGQGEKVQLSLVMSRRAKLYILDEPIGAVDPASRDFILDTIIKNYDRTASILLSTHIISDIEPILDRAFFLKDGQLIMSGDADDIREEHGASLDNVFRKVFANSVEGVSHVS